MKTLAILFLLLFTSCAHSSDSKRDPSKKIMGWLEYANLEGDVLVKAKLDSGAKTSSIHGIHIKNFKKGKEKWVRFTFEDVDALTKKPFKKEYERKVVRFVRIKDHKTKSRRRPVVEMEFAIDGKKYTTEFSVTSRKRFHYPLLLGRRFLKDVVYIDSAETFLLYDVKNEPSPKK